MQVKFFLQKIQEVVKIFPIFFLISIKVFWKVNDFGNRNGLYIMRHDMMLNHI